MFFRQPWAVESEGRDFLPGTLCAPIRSAESEAPGRSIAPGVGAIRGAVERNFGLVSWRQSIHKHLLLENARLLKFEIKLRSEPQKQCLKRLGNQWIEYTRKRLFLHKQASRKYGDRAHIFGSETYELQWWARLCRIWPGDDYCSFSYFAIAPDCVLRNPGIRYSKSPVSA